MTYDVIGIGIGTGIQIDHFRGNNAMPTIAIVDGVKIQFYFDEHPPPHFHAVFAEFVAQIQIDPPRILRGLLPPSQLKAVVAFASKYRAGLMSTWADVAADQKPEKLQ